MDSRQESLIEALALNPGFLSDEELNEARGLIAKSPQASHLYDYFTSFYQEFNRPSHTLVSKRVQEFKKSLLENKSCLRLYPRAARVRDPESGNTAKSRLAASAGVQHRFELLGSSISSDEQVNVRFLRDTTNSIVRVFIVAGDPSVYSNAMLLFEGTGVYLVLDQNGQAQMDASMFEGLQLVGKEVAVLPLTEKITLNLKELSPELSPVPYCKLEGLSASFSEGFLEVVVSSREVTILGQLETDASWRHVLVNEPNKIPENDSDWLTLRVYG